MSTKIINIRFGDKQKAISLDKMLFDLYAIKKGSAEQANKEIRDFAKKHGENLNSRIVKHFLTLEIADSKLVEKYINTKGGK